MLEKAFLKFPKSATQISGLKRTPPPLELFRKFIGFDTAILTDRAALHRWDLLSKKTGILGPKTPFFALSYGFFGPV